MKLLIIHGNKKSNLPSGETISIEHDRKVLEDFATVHLEIFEGPNFSPIKAPIWFFCLFWSKRNYDRTLAIIREFKPDVVHFHNIGPQLSLSPLFAAKKFNLPTIQTLHNVKWVCVDGAFFRHTKFCDKCLKKSPIWGVFHGCARGYVKSLMNYVFTQLFLKINSRYKLIDTFIAVSEYIRDVHVKAGFEGDKIVVKYNSRKFFRPDETSIKSALYYRGVRYVVFAGRISNAKGARILSYLISHSTFAMKIIGDGPELPRLKLLVRETGRKNVEFLGVLDHNETVNQISESEVVLVPSQCGEAFSLVAAEAMLHGIPIVASNVGGLAEIVSKSGSGFIIEKEDFTGFEVAINRIFRDKKVSTNFSRNGFAFAEKHFTSLTSASFSRDLYANQ